MANLAIRTLLLKSAWKIDQWIYLHIWLHNHQRISHLTCQPRPFFGFRIYGVNSDCNISGFVFLRNRQQNEKSVSWIHDCSGYLHSIYIAFPLKIEGGYIEFLLVSVPHLCSPGTIIKMWQINAYRCKELWTYSITLFEWLVQFLIAVLQPDEVESVTPVVSTLPLSKIMSWYDLPRQ